MEAVPWPCLAEERQHLRQALTPRSLLNTAPFSMPGTEASRLITGRSRRECGWRLWRGGCLPSWWAPTSGKAGRPPFTPGNGPGRFARGPNQYGHPYEGDGLIASFAFDGSGRVFFRSRFVRTPEFEAEENAGRVLFRGSFDTNISGGLMPNFLNLYIKNNSNTSVVHWGTPGQLITMFEAAPAYKLDPASLVTKGQELLGGRLAPGIPVDLGTPDANAALGRVQHALGNNRLLPVEQMQGGGDAFTAHPHVDPATNRLLTFTYRIKPGAINPLDTETEFRFWEIDPHWNVVACKTWQMPDYGFMHDFAFTENYYILFQGPVETDQLPYLLGQTCAASTVRWKPGTPTSIYVIPRPGSQAESIGYDSLPAVGKQAAAPDPLSQGLKEGWRFLIKALTGRTPALPMFIEPDAGFKAFLVRTELSWDPLPAKGREQGAGAAAAAPQFGEMSASVSRLWDQYLELTCVNEAYQGRKHRYIYGYSSKFDSACIGLAKIDTQVAGNAQRWAPGWGVMITEPTFCPRPGGSAEDDGWLLATVNDTERGESQLWVFDAWALMAGPIAKQTRSMAPLDTVQPDQWEPPGVALPDYCGRDAAPDEP
ncbi:retinal pigment epithelial membrane protein-domain-containing protein [Haematococcus lacustris]